MEPRESNVTDYLLRDRNPEALALLLPQSQHTYGELERRVSDLLAHFQTLPVQAGDRVILGGENSLHWVASYLAILRAGLVCVPVPSNASLEDLDYIREITEASVVCADKLFRRRSRERFTNCTVIVDGDPLPFHRLGPLPEIQPNQLAALMFTSGSTGKPRGVMVSHANIIANTESIIEYLGLTAADRIMAVLPFHYCFGASLLHTHLRVGGSVVVEPRFLYPEVVLDRLIESRCTGFAGVPSHFQILLHRSTLKTRRFPHLRYVQQAGGRLAPAFIEELAAALPGTDVFVMYGQTEATARLSYLPPSLLGEKLGSIGKGIPGVTLSVLNESGQPVGPGEVGEIVAEGANVTAGYWRSPAETTLSFRDGKLHTGDLATVDADGFLYVAGRAKDFLKCGGKRVSCRQIEDLALSADEVLEAAVVSMPDEVLVEAARLFVVPRGKERAGLENKLRLLCRSRLAPELVPRDIVLLRSLPKNSSGKVLKEELKKEFPCLSPY